MRTGSRDSNRSEPQGGGREADAEGEDQVGNDIYRQRRGIGTADASTVQERQDGRQGSLRGREYPLAEFRCPM